MTETKYSMSFTAGGLLFRESIEIARLYVRLNHWPKVKAAVIENNVLQARTQNSAKRVFREISSRLERLTKEELMILDEGSRLEQIQILWLAICKRYQFIYEFAVEVIREKYLILALELSFEDYDVFFNSKAEWHEELENLTAATKEKLRQVVFKILHEIDFLSKDNRMMPRPLAPRVHDAISKDDPQYLSIFPAIEDPSRGRTQQ